LRFILARKRDADDADNADDADISDLVRVVRVPVLVYACVVCDMDTDL